MVAYLDIPISSHTNDPLTPTSVQNQNKNPHIGKKFTSFCGSSRRLPSKLNKDFFIDTLKLIFITPNSRTEKQTGLLWNVILQTEF